MTLPDPTPTAKPHAIRARLEKFSTREEFARGYRQYLSADGILLPTRQLKPVGTRVALKLELANGDVALRADGVVTEHKVNSRGQSVGMHIHFDRIEAASRAVLQMAQQADETDSAIPSDPTTESEPSHSGVRPDLDAFAEELDSTFDSIFATGAFASVEDPDFQSAISRPGIPAPAAVAPASADTPGVDAVARRADSRRREWANTLSSDFSVAESSEQSDSDQTGDEDRSSDDSVAPEDRSDDRAAQLLAAFGISPTDDAHASDPPRVDDDASPPIGATTENSSAHALGRISFNRLPASEVAPRRTDEPRGPSALRLTEDSTVTERPIGSAWLDDAMRASNEASHTTPDVASLQRLISRVTSEHAVVGGGSESTPELERPEADDLDALLGLTSEAADNGPAPVPTPMGLPRRAITGSDETAGDAPQGLAAVASNPDSGETSVSATGADTSSAAADAPASSTLPVPARPGLVARFFAWLRSLFGSTPK